MKSNFTNGGFPEAPKNNHQIIEYGEYCRAVASGLRRAELGDNILVWCPHCNEQYDASEIKNVLNHAHLDKELKI